MKIHLVQTTGWYDENGQSTWGVGIEVLNFATRVYGEDDAEWLDRLDPEGWQVSIRFGAWALDFTSDKGWSSLNGPGLDHQPLFEVVRS